MEPKKKSKPLMEKKRRARINVSQAELKSLLRDVIKEEGTRHNKMEKADILEMTVRYVRRLHQQHQTGRTCSINIYQVGYNECISEIGKFLKSKDIVQTDVHSRLLDHLINNAFESKSSHLDLNTDKFDINNNGDTPSNLSATPNDTSTLIDRTTSSTTSFPFQEEKQLNNCSVLSLPQQPCNQSILSSNTVNGIQLIPTKLVSGHVAFILPSNAMQSNPPLHYVVTNPSPSLQTNANISPGDVHNVSDISSPVNYQTVIQAHTSNPYSIDACTARQFETHSTGTNIDSDLRPKCTFIPLHAPGRSVWRPWEHL